MTIKAAVTSRHRRMVEKSMDGNLCSSLAPNTFEHTADELFEIASVRKKMRV